MTKMLYLLILISIFNSLSIQAQDATQINIVYEMQHKRDLNTDRLIVQKDMLSLSKSASRFVNLSIFNSNSKAAIEARKLMMEKIKSASTSTMRTVSGSPMIAVSKEGVKVTEEIMTYPNDKTYSVTGLLGLMQYNYVSKIPPIKWSLKSDRKTILGYECQKAVGDFGGRTYEVWFTAVLPYNFGPWKLNGLPGLILEAHDSKNEISYVAKEITKNTDPDEQVISYLQSENAIKVKEKEYKATLRQYILEPETLTAAQFPNTKVMVSNTDNPNDKTVKSVKKYNPIELR
ncbi:MAG: GLPGLI family protein [Bacteroidia bacterium]|nr:MAG: GLPGLI family protein [Bacteroidia bacterium]